MFVVEMIDACNKSLHIQIERKARRAWQALTITGNKGV